MLIGLLLLSLRDIEEGLDESLLPRFMMGRLYCVRAESMYPCFVGHSSVWSIVWW